MTVGELKKHLSVRDDTEEVSVWYREEENLQIVEINEPG